MSSLPCPRCEFPVGFISAQALKAHLAEVHFAYRPYICDECGGVSRFATRQELADHYEMAHGRQQYSIRFDPNEKELAILESLSLKYASEHISNCIKNSVDEAMAKADPMSSTHCVGLLGRVLLPTPIPHTSTAQTDARINASVQDEPEVIELDSSPEPSGSANSNNLVPTGGGDHASETEYGRLISESPRSKDSRHCAMQRIIASELLPDTYGAAYKELRVLITRRARMRKGQRDMKTPFCAKIDELQTQLKMMRKEKAYKDAQFEARKRLAARACDKK